MKLPDDPLAWVLQNSNSLVVMNALRTGAERAPLEIRKGSGIHPELFRKVVHTLAGYGLVAIHARKGARLHRVPRGWGIEVVLELTPKGFRILETIDEIREVIRRHATELPRPTVERWLPS